MADFRTIHTTSGLTAMAQAEASGVPINLTHMAVGDGNGNPVTPSEGQTVLAREMFRATVNRVFQDPATPNKFTAELVIPASVGGFVLREVGIFDSTGSLFAAGNLPDTYKPMASEGAYADTVVRLEFLVTNASVVTLQIDPNVAVATQTWISNNVTAATLIPGGTTGQLLAKSSNSDGDYIWQDPSEANVVVDTIEETQTLAAAQTTVVLSLVTTNGLAVYVDKKRLEHGAGADGWLEDVTDPDTKIILGTAYPAGTRIILVQNEPLGDVPFPLARDQNLADVPDKALGRANLGVYSKPETDQKAPAGAVMYFARTNAPSGWLKANGAAISRTAYAALFAAIGTTFGEGDSFTTFNLPDLRGEFIRGWDDARGADGGRLLGSAQAGSIQSHSHSGSTAEAGSHVHGGTAQSAGLHNHSASTGPAGEHNHTVPYTIRGDGFGGSYAMSAADGGTNKNTSTTGEHSHSVSVGNSGEHSHALNISAGGTHSHSITIGETGGGETRPRNVALLACIKY